VLDRAFLRPAGRLAMAAQVARDYVIRALELLDLVPPIFVRTGKAVHEDQRR
jgi:hypothetical protein